MMSQRSTGGIAGLVADATLRQALLWAALGLEPLEERFEALKKYPVSVADVLPADQEKVENAKLSIAEKLMTGRLTAYACVKVTPGNEDHLEFYPSGRVAVPPEFWHPTEIEWDKSDQRGKDFYWGDVTIAVADLSGNFRSH